MNITREVITDLLPLYLAGESSEDSNILILKFLESDPEFAQLIARSNQDDVLLKKISSPDNELSILVDTKRLINLRSWMLGIALFFTASLFGVRSIGNGIEWLWTGFMPGFVIYLLLTIGTWSAYLYLRHRLSDVGV